MDEKTTIPVSLADLKGALGDVLEKIKFSNGAGVTLVDFSIGDSQVELTLRYPD